MSKGGKFGLGSVMTCIVSPKRMLLVEDESFADSFKKLPGGSIEQIDADVIAAAIREVREETGIQLLREEVELILEEQNEKGKYRPYLCLARISEEKLDTRLEIADENGHPMMTKVFPRMQVSTMRGLLEKHRSLVCEAETLFA
jgi:ADP-ribose pyrophosphatase YjhB (NUDIX family)